MGSRDDDDLRIGRVKPATPSSAAEGASEVPALERTTGVGRVAEAAAVSATDAIAAALSAGDVTPTAAQTQLIENAVRAQLPEHASPELIAAVAREVEALLAEDPTLVRWLGEPAGRSQE